MAHIFRRTTILVFLLLLGTLGGTSLTSRAAINAASLTPLDEYGGAVARVTVAGSYAYIGMGPRLVRLSLADPLHPAFTGQSSILPGSVTAITVQGQAAYVTDSAKNLHVFDLSTASLGAPANTLALPAAATDVAADATQLIVAEGSYGIEAYSLGAPLLPAFSIKRTCPGEANGVALSAGKVYVACTSAGVGYFEDFYNTGKNPIAYPFTSPQVAMDVAVSGKNVFVATDLYGITSLELTTSGSSPSWTYKDDINISNHTTRLALSGSYAYVAVEDVNYWDPVSAGSFLDIVNISNPASLTAAGHLYYRGDAVDVAYLGSAVYMAGMDGGLRAINAAAPASPAASGVYNPLGIALHLQAGSSKIYAASDWQGLVMLSSSPAGKLSGLGQYSPAGLDTTWVAVAGSYAYLANRAPTMSVVNIANPVAPTLAGSYTSGNAAFYVGVSGSTAYVGEWIGSSPYHSHIQAVNVSNPAAPTPGVVNSLPASGEHSFISGSYLYVANGSSGLRILNLSDLSEAGNYPGIPYANAVAVYGDTAYVLNMDTVPPYTGAANAIYVINVTNKASLATVRTIPLNGQTMRLAVDGSTLYATACTGGLHIYDLTVPTNPVQTATYTPPGCSVSVAADDNLVYLSTDWSGVYSLWYENPRSASIPTGGGSLTDETGTVELVFPSGTFSSSATITLRRPPPQEMPSLQSARAQGVIWGGVYYTATSSGPTALKPYTVNLFYTHDMLTTIVESTLGVFYWSGSAWLKEMSLAATDLSPTGVDPALNKVTFTTTHFGAFALFGETNFMYVPAVRR